MRPILRRSRLLLAILAIPALSGCAALGLPDLPGSTLLPFGSDVVDLSPAPDASSAPAAVGYVASADGYSLSIPGGWGALDLSGEDAFALADAVALVDPRLGELARTGLERSDARLSLVAADLVAAAAGGYSPGVLVTTMRTRGMEKGAARNLVEDLLAEAPLAADPIHSVEGLPAGDAHRYDAIVLGDTVDLQLRIHVFRVGGDSFVVAAVAPDDQFEGAQPVFDRIVKSLRFGV